MDYGAKHIKVLEGLEAMRRHKSMYIDECNINGQLQIVFELFDNSKDEHEATEPIEPIEILICFKEDTYQMILVDRGRGIPVIDEVDPNRDVLRILSQVLHASGKFDAVDEDSPYEAPTGTHGIGLKAAMGLSNHAFILTSHKIGNGFVQYKKGEEVHYKIEAVNNLHTGTIIMFEPDPEMLTDLNLFKTQGLEMLINYVEFISVFIDRDVRINVSGYNKWFDMMKFYDKIKDDLSKGFDIVNKIKKEKLIFEYKEKITLEQYIRDKFSVNTDFIWELVNIHKRIDKKKEDDRLGFDIELFLPETLRVNKGGILTTVNMKMITDPTSYHVTILAETIKSYMEGMIPDNSIKEYFRLIYKLPLYCVIRIRYKGAAFVGQTKKGFKDQTFSLAYKESLFKIFDELDPKVWEDLFEFIYPDIEERYKANYNKNFVSNQGLKNISLKLENSEGYKSCTCKDKSLCELYIVEGASAFDSCSRACNNYNQAIFALQGKPVNGFRIDDEEFLKDSLIKDLILILGVTSKDKNLDNMNFNEIFILADADYHGYHISILILGNLYKINPLIISEGRVRLSNPPMHSLANKNRVIYLKDNNALMEMKINALYKKVFRIHAMYQNSGIKTLIEGETFINMCHLVTHICKIIEQASLFIGMNPKLVEVMLKHLDYVDGEYILDIEKVRVILGASVAQEKKDYITFNIKETDLIIPWRRFKDECRKYLYRDYNQFNCKNFQLYITSLLVEDNKEEPISLFSLYELMNELDKKIGRFSYFKGLGEMEDYQLRETCFGSEKSSVKITRLGDLKIIYGMLDVDTDMRKELTSSY